MYICIYIYTYIYDTSIVCMYVCMYAVIRDAKLCSLIKQEFVACAHVCTCMCTCMHMYVHVHMYARACAYVWLIKKNCCMYIWLVPGLQYSHIFMYVNTHIHLLVPCYIYIYI